MVSLGLKSEITYFDDLTYVTSTRKVGQYRLAVLCFKEAARELDTGDDAAKFNKKPGKLVKPKPEDNKPNKGGK